MNTALVPGLAVMNMTKILVAPEPDHAAATQAAWGSSDPGTAGQSALAAASGIALPAAQPSYLWFEQWRPIEYDPADVAVYGKVVTVLRRL